MEILIKKKKKIGHLVLEFGGLEYCSWYPSPANSSTPLVHKATLKFQYLIIKF